MTDLAIAANGRRKSYGDKVVLGPTPGGASPSGIVRACPIPSRPAPAPLPTVAP